MKTGSFFTLWGARRAVIPIAGIIFLFVGSVAMGQLSTVPRDDFWITDGPVNALLVTNGLIYVGGDFQSVGPQRAFGVLVDNNTSVAAMTSPRLDELEPVTAAVSDGTSGWILSILSQVSRLIRVRADGSVDPNWNVVVGPRQTDVSGAVLAMLVSSNRLFVGGQFESIAGAPRRNLASLDLTTGQALDWDPGAGGRDDVVRALALSGQTLYVGGGFGMVGGADRLNLAAVDTETGAPTAWNPRPDGGVFALSLLDTNLYVGGQFTTIGSAFRTNLAALKLSNGFATAWNPNPDALVIAIASFSNTVFVTGAFTNIGGATRNSLAGIDVVSGAATAWNPDPSPPLQPYNYFPVGLGYSSLLAVNDGVLFVAGSFRSIAGELRGATAAFDLATGGITDWDPYVTGGVIVCIASHGGQTFLGGTFKSVNGVPRRGLAALDAGSGVATSWNPGVTGSVKALATEGQSIFVGGSFTQVGLQPRTNLAQVGIVSGQVTAWNPGADGIGLYYLREVGVYALAIAGNTVYVGGQFQSVAGQSRTNLAAIGFDGSLTSWNPGGDNGLTAALLASGNLIYVGGEFSYLGGQPRGGLGAVDLASGAAAAFNPQINLPPGVQEPRSLGLATQGTDLFTSGSVHDYRPVIYFPFVLSVGSFAPVDSTTHYYNLEGMFAQNPGLTGPFGIAVTATSVYVCDPTGSTLLISVNPGSGAIQPWLPAGSGGGIVRSLAPLGDSLVATGEFGTINGVPLANIAVFPPLGYARLGAQLLSNGGLRLEVVGDPSVSSVLQTTTNFQSWIPLTTNSGTFHYDVTNIVQSAPTYYRSVSQP